MNNLNNAENHTPDRNLVALGEAYIAQATRTALQAALGKVYMGLRKSVGAQCINFGISYDEFITHEYELRNPKPIEPVQSKPDAY